MNIDFTGKQLWSPAAAQASDAPSRMPARLLVQGPQESLDKAARITGSGFNV